MRMRAPFLLALLFGLALAGVAVASDSDLQTYGGSSTWNNNPQAQNLLLPVDGTKITADANTAGKGPVNRGTKQLKDFVNGIHDGVFGSRSGATRRTLKSLEVDGAGGAASTIPGGEIQALGNISTVGGDVLVPGGAVTASGIVKSTGGSLISEVGSIISGDVLGANALLTPALLKFLGTGTLSTDANPPQGTAIPNQLRAKNIEKVTAFVRMSAGNTFVSYDGVGVQALAIVALTSFPGQAGIRVTFATPFANTDYQAVATAAADTTRPAEHVMEDMAMRFTTSCTFFFKSSAVVAGALQFIDPSATPVNFSLRITGQQNT